ncbi:MAG: hypothetical protein OXG44_01425 [Gammaproteobacteria bacterium]|nr:hypothetical protein [Gammaproteobacteria bacterium]
MDAYAHAHANTHGDADVDTDTDPHCHAVADRNQDAKIRGGAGNDFADGDSYGDAFTIAYLYARAAGADLDAYLDAAAELHEDARAASCADGDANAGKGYPSYPHAGFDA